MNKRNIVKEKLKERLNFLIEDFNLKEKDLIEVNYEDIIEEIYLLIKDLNNIDKINIDNYFIKVFDKYLFD